MASEEEVVGVLKTVYDPEIPVNIYDLGLIYRIDAQERRIEVDMTLTSPGCPVGPAIKAEVRDKLMELPGLDDVVVNIVFKPAWSPQKATEEGKLHLEMLGVRV